MPTDGFSSVFPIRIQSVSDAMECYQFDVALKAIREFAWDILADNYIELVKGRLYTGERVAQKCTPRSVYRL